MKRTLNLSPINYWTEQPFLNRIQGAMVDRRAMNAIRGSILAPVDSPAGTRFILTWTGGGTCSLGAGMKIVSSAPGMIVFESDGKGNGKGSWQIVLRSDGQSNHRLCKLGEEALLARGEVFRPEFLDDMQRFDAFRCMDWTATNGSPRTTMDTNQLRLIANLANRTGARPWVCTPHLITDAGIKALVSFLEANCQPRPILEFSNEVWNWGFGQARYAQSLPGKPDPSLWDGLNTARLLKAAAGTRIGVVAMSQIVDVTKLRRVLQGVRAGGADPARLEALGGTTYVAGDLPDFAAAPTLALRLMAANDVNGALDHLMAKLPRQREWYQLFAAEAKRLNIAFWAYEGGQFHLNSRQAGPLAERLRQFFYAVQMHPRSADVLQAYYKAFEAAGGSMDAMYNWTSGSTLDGFFGVRQQPIWSRLPLREGLGVVLRAGDLIPVARQFDAYFKMLSGQA